MKPRKIFLPPIWLAVVLSFLGIFGMNLVYESFTKGGLLEGVIGAILLVVSVVAVGTPLAMARMIRKEHRDRQKA